MEYIHEVTIDCSNYDLIKNAFLFIGPVKGGSGFQMNPNRITANIINSMIIKGDVHKEKFCPKS